MLQSIYMHVEIYCWHLIFFVLSNQFTTKYAVLSLNFLSENIFHMHSVCLNYVILSV